MKKIIKWIVSGVLLIVIGIVGYFTYKHYLYVTYGQYNYVPKSKVVAVTSIDKQAKVVAWKVVNPRENRQMKKHASAYYYDPTSVATSFGGRYLLDQSFKLKGSHQEYKGRGDSDERWDLAVYDLKAARSKMKYYDIFKTVAAYGKGYKPYKVQASNQFFYQGDYYIWIIIRKGGSNKKILRFLNLRTGIMTNLPKGVKTIQLGTINFGLFPKLEERFQKQGIVTVYGDRFLISSSKGSVKNWSMKTSYPKAYALMTQGKGELYLLDNVSKVPNYQSILSLFFPKGTNIFRKVTIPAAYSVDGQKHTVNSYEEFVQYYQVSNGLYRKVK